MANNIKCNVIYDKGKCIYCSIDKSIIIPKSQLNIESISIPKYSDGDFYSIRYNYLKRNNYIFNKTIFVENNYDLTLENTTYIEPLVIEKITIEDFIKLNIFVLTFKTNNAVNNIIESPRYIKLSLNFIPVYDLKSNIYEWMSCINDIAKDTTKGVFEYLLS